MRLKMRTLVWLIFVLIGLFGLCVCAPQGYYYNNNYPYRRSGYSYSAANKQIAAPATSRPNIYSATTNTNINSKYSNSNDRYAVRKSAASERGKYRVSKADSENAKFVGAPNQEAADESRALGLFRRKNRNRCLPFGRSAAAGRSAGTTPAPTEQGRFLFDLNVYNVYPNGGGGGGYFPGGVQSSPLFGAGGGCGGGGGFGGLGLGGLGGGLGGLGGGLGGLGGGLGGLGGGLGGLGGGLFSDPVAQGYPPAPPPLNNFLGLFAPGILQNALAATARPRPQYQPDPTGTGDVNDLQSDPEVDPGYRPPPPPPVRRPNRVYYDSAGVAPITPAQLIGGVATTVNGIIQQLTGSVQPVYPSYRRSANYG